MMSDHGIGYGGYRGSELGAFEVIYSLYYRPPQSRSLRIYYILLMQERNPPLFFVVDREALRERPEWHANLKVSSSINQSFLSFVLLPPYQA